MTRVREGKGVLHIGTNLTHSLSFLHHARILECSPSRESPPTFPSHHVSINGTITEFDSFPFTRDLLT